MSEQESNLDRERRLRRAAVVANTRQAPEEPDAREQSAPDEVEEPSAAARMEQQALWVDLQIRRAIERGEFDNLPGAGKPIPGLASTHDPDWWVKSLIEREQITGVLPPALALRGEHADLDSLIDRETTEAGVRRVVEDFNERVVEARRQLLGGPPVITPTREVDQEVAAWRDRRIERQERLRRERERAAAEVSAPGYGGRRTPWWFRRKRRGAE